MVDRFFLVSFEIPTLISHLIEHVETVNTLSSIGTVKAENSATLVFTKFLKVRASQLNVVPAFCSMLSNTSYSLTWDEMALRGYQICTSLNQRNE